MTAIDKRLLLRGISLLLIFTFLTTCFTGYAPAAQAADLPEISSEPVSLSSLDAGSLLQFGGYQWIVLKPSEGLLLMQAAYGDPRPFDTGVSRVNETYDPSLYPYNIGNIGYLLNGEFLESMSATDQARIVVHDWDTGHQGAYNDWISSCKVGLLNLEQVSTYAGILKTSLLYPENTERTDGGRRLGIGRAREISG